MKKILSSVLVAGMLLSVGVVNATAADGASGPKSYNAVGKIGAVIMNPYGVAPLTAIINDGRNIIGYIDSY
ncbi:Arylsulfate sulfotransferase AssT [Campylobacter ureolyticus]|uniref:Arylsulfate sulfotransferase AssT n=1 Tax=Campylobacter ureolyticus TaxID=827 RepID=A0A6N2S3T2_9BACT